MKKYKSTIIFLFICAAFMLFESNSICRKKKLNHTDSVNVLTNVIRKNGQVTSSHTGYAGSPSDSYYAFILLLKTANTNEFYLLTKDTSASLRVYSYYSLIYHDDVRVKEVKSRLEKDSSQVMTMSGCIVMRTTVAELINGPYTFYYKEEINHTIEELEKQKEYREMLFQKFRKIKS